MKDYDEPIDDEEIEERGIPSVGRQNNSSKLLPALFAGGLLALALFIMFGNGTPDNTNSSVIPASVQGDFSTGVKQPPQISAFEQFRQRLFQQNNGDAPATPTLAPQGETQLEKRLRLARERQALELERDRQAAALKASAQRLAFEQKRLEQKFRLEQAELEELKQREKAKTLVFDVSTDKEQTR